MNIIKIVHGNDFWLQLNVTKKLIGGSSSTPFDLNLLADRHLFFKSLGRMELPTITTDVTGQLLVHCVGVPVGAYEIELCGKYNGGSVRSAELHMVEVVRTNGEGTAPSGTYEGEDSYSVDLSVQLYTGVALNVVDEVEEGNLNAVTSNAVFEELETEKAQIDVLITDAETMLENVTNAISDAEQATTDAISATENANTIYNEVKDAYERGDFNGKDGGVLYPSFNINNEGHLVAIAPDSEADMNIELNASGHLLISIL